MNRLVTIFAIVVVLWMLATLLCERNRSPEPRDPWQPSLFERERQSRPRLPIGRLVSIPFGCAWPKGTQIPLYGDRECSRSPDLAPECCGYHDTDYAVGGTEQDRLVADLELAWCFALFGVDERIIGIYYRSVRKFGESSFNFQDHRTRGPPEKPGGWRREFSE